MSRAFGGTLDHPLCVEEMAQTYNTYSFMGKSEWFGWLIRGLEEKDGKIGVKEVWVKCIWVELWECVQSIKGFVFSF